jgi:hypothetical protein
LCALASAGEIRGKAALLDGNPAASLGVVGGRRSGRLDRASGRARCGLDCRSASPLRVRGGKRLTTQRGSGSPTESAVVASFPDCVGFRVDTSLGPIGVVEEFRRHEGRISEFAVRAGKQGSRLLIFPASDISQVIPGDRRVTLRPEFHLTSSEALSASAGHAATSASRADSQGRAQIAGSSEPALPARARPTDGRRPKSLLAPLEPAQ